MGPPAVDSEARLVAQEAKQTAVFTREDLARHVDECAERTGRFEKKLDKMADDSREKLDKIAEDSKASRARVYDKVDDLAQTMQTQHAAQREQHTALLNAMPALPAVTPGATVMSLEIKLLRGFGVGALALIAYLLVNGVPWAK